MFIAAIYPARSKGQGKLG